MSASKHEEIQIFLKIVLKLYYLWTKSNYLWSKSYYILIKNIDIFVPDIFENSSLVVLVAFACLNPLEYGLNKHIQPQKKERTPHQSN